MRVARGQHLERVGIQLYSVRSLLARDFDGTLEQLASIGYREVEFAGYHGRSPAQVRASLARFALTAPSTHLELKALRANPDDAIHAAREIGHEYITSAWIDADERRTLDDWRARAADLDRIGERVRAHGLRLAYHNHSYDVAPIGGVIPFDLLLAETSPELVSYEMDVYWVTAGGADPLSYLRRYPARFPMLHLKDSGGAPDHPMVNLGTGTIDFAAILGLVDDQRHDVRHAFVEHDEPADPMAFARDAYAFMRRLEY
jgi:sugar phosphate isomerase/epimerase